MNQAMNPHLHRNVPLHLQDIADMESSTTSTEKMDGTGNPEDVNALMGYIRQLEISLKKKDQRIAQLEGEVSVMKGGDVKSAAPIFRAKPSDEAATPRSPPDRDQSQSSTPNQVSDDSGEIEPASEDSGLSDSLSHIAHAHSSEGEDSSPEHAEDGRWNIPFDGSFEDLVAKSPSDKARSHENALQQIGFVPICKEGRRRQSGCREAVTPLRPVARRSLGSSSPFALASRNDKENVSPKVSASMGIRGLRNIR